ncbi:Bug family tripartite tricarboxylate transporter substrate binding protein [Azospirillum himalayense]|uniref:Bug family tripartite tricarboxylate transporter substrate binding protein n=1 Tax=Azospirillum himalayense TaxID=654847 RepID=A0ABW0G9X2_9PROT
MKRVVTTLGALLLAFGVAATAMADTYPSQTIRLVVPYPPGGVSDLVGRVVADGLKAKLNQTVIVDNKPGANGVIGTQDVIRSKPDGYSLLVGGLGGLVLPPLVDPNFPVDVDKTLTPIAGIAEFVNVMIVNKDLPVNTVQDFIDYAKARPGQLNFGSTGIGASNHLTAELFMQKTGVKMEHIPYKGGTAALNDLRGGSIHVVFENLPTVVGQIKAGAVKALAVTSPYRAEQLPDVPTIAESGIKDFTVTSWMGMYGPKGLSPDLKAKIAAALVEVARDPSTKERLQTISFLPVDRDTEAFTGFVKAEHDRWKQVVDTAGVKVEE